MLPTMALCFHAGVHHLGIIRQFAPETLITDHHSFQASTNVYLFGACCNRNSTLQRNAMGKLCRALQVAAMLLNGKNRWNCFGTRLRYRYVMVCHGMSLWWICKCPGEKQPAKVHFSSTRETVNAYSSMSRTHHESRSVFLQKSLVFQI